jgi:SNF2 family DNA or RNA helicase
VWCSNFNTVVYFGNQESREIIRRKEFFISRKCNKITATGALRQGGEEEEERLCRFNILVTGYESAMIDLKFLKRINWQVIVTDEAQRLKNNESKFFKMSRLLKTRQKILLTGTPIQNSIMELINLIDFINPAKAKNLKTVEKMRVFLDANRAISDQKNSKEGVEVTEEEKQKAINE